MTNSVTKIKPNALHIYTDGSCCFDNVSVGAWSSVIVQDDYLLFGLTGNQINTNINAMELMSVVKTLKFIYESKYRKHQLVIHTDSACIIEVIENNYISKWRKNKWRSNSGKRIVNVGLWKELMFYITHCNVKFVKVKSHSGVYWNDFADTVCSTVAKNIKKNIGGNNNESK